MLHRPYRRRLEADLARWVENGWVSAEAAARIRGDVAAGTGADRFRLPALLGGIGAICLALAVVAFVAANWEAIPRPAKLAGIAGLLIAAHGVAGWSATRGLNRIADLATLFATLVFVAGLALVGQMYHLPTDWAGGAMLVVLGALAAAWGTGSRAALVVAALASLVWLAWREDVPTLTPAGLLIAGFLLAATVAHVIRHPALAGRWAVLAHAGGTYAWLVAGALHAGAIAQDDTFALAVLLAHLCFAAALAVWGYALARDERLSARVGEGVRGLAGAAMYLGVVLLAGGVMVTLVVAFALETPEIDAGAVLTLWPVVLMLAGACLGAGWLLRAGKARAAALGIALASLAGPVVGLALMVAPALTVLHAVLALGAMIAIAMAGSGAHLLSWTLVGNLGIAAVLLFLLQETIGSLLGQSVFFLLAGLVLIGVAGVSARMVKRRSAPLHEQGEGA